MFIIKVVEESAPRRTLLFDAIDPSWRWLEEGEYKDYKQSYDVYGLNSADPLEEPKKAIAVSFGAPGHDRTWPHIMPVEGFVAVKATVYIMNQAGKTIEQIRVQPSITL